MALSCLPPSAAASPLLMVVNTNIPSHLTLLGETALSQTLNIPWQYGWAGGEWQMCRVSSAKKRLKRTHQVGVVFKVRVHLRRRRLRFLHKQLQVCSWRSAEKKKPLKVKNGSKLAPASKVSQILQCWMKSLFFFFLSFFLSDCLAAKYLLGSGHNHSIIRKPV